MPPGVGAFTAGSSGAADTGRRLAVQICATRTPASPPRLPDVVSNDTSAHMPAPTLRTLTPLEVRDALASRTDVILVDVRELSEHAVAQIESATLIPLKTLPARHSGLAREHAIILLCHHGMRSEVAGNFLLAEGFRRVSHMAGGIERWSGDVDTSVKKY